MGRSLFVFLSLGAAFGQIPEGLLQMLTGDDDMMGGGAGTVTSFSSSTEFVQGSDGQMHKQVKEMQEETDGGVHTQRATACRDGLCKETIRRSIAPPQEASPMGMMQMHQRGRPLLLSMNRGMPMGMGGGAPMQVMLQGAPQQEPQEEEMARGAAAMMGGLMQQFVGALQGQQEGHSPEGPVIEVSLERDTPKEEAKVPEPKKEELKEETKATKPKAEEPKAASAPAEKGIVVASDKPMWKGIDLTEDDNLMASMEA